jgi:hypothetical protein
VPVVALLEVAPAAPPAPPAPVALLEVELPPLVVVAAVVESPELVEPPAPVDVVDDVLVSPPPLQAAKPVPSVTSPRTTAA